MKSELKIVADDKIPFLRGVLEPYARVVYLPGGAITPADVADADGLITRTRTCCDARLLADSRVRCIATATIGFDHLDVAWLESRGISWGNAPGCNAAGVAQYLAAVLTDSGEPLAGRTLGVVGVGNVGSRVAEVGRALGMRVLLSDPPRAERGDAGEFLPLETLVRESDVLSFHVPMVREGRWPTFHLADGALFAGLKPGATVVNSSRGGVVESDALKQALRSGRVARAVLDVWEHEPAIDPELHRLVEIGTPHIAGYSTDGKANGTAMAVRQIARFFGIAPLEQWRPAELPEPERPRIELDASMPEPEQLRDAVRRSYEIRFDDRMLREDPAGFERQRGSYRIRREFPAFTVSGGSPAVRRRLARLGFQLQQS